METSIVKNSRYEILTPDGWSDFDGVRASPKSTSLLFEFSDGNVLECTPCHKLELAGGVFAEARDLLIGERISTGARITDIRTLHQTKLFYDALNVKKEKRYYTNGVVSHNCEFLGSADTLIAAEVLASMKYVRPQRKNNTISIFQEPEKGHQYMIVADVARGGGGDFSAFVVVDVTKFPYSVAATYRDNTVTPVVYPNFIHQASLMYNNAYILVEVNDVGGQIADILNYELENENLLMVTMSGKKGQSLGGGFGKTARYGVKTTPAVKRIGCFAVKGLIENNQLVVNDFEIVSEFSTFVHDGVNYGAEYGKHDDLVMCLVLFAWATTQKYFKELVDSDVRLRILAEREAQLEEDMLPFGVYDDGQGDEDTTDIAPIPILGDFDSMLL